MVAIIDYGVGNLFSLTSSLKAVGGDTVITGDPAVICSADKLILPGVGAFGDAAEKLEASGLRQVIIDQAHSGKPVMGICLGMQLLFEKSFEYGEHTGLGLLKGEIVPMAGSIPDTLKIPHIGWNGLHKVRDSFLLTDVRENDCVYFVHSFYGANCADSLVATAEYGKELPAIVQKGNIMGCQFHPEKSGRVGLTILKNFVFGVSR